MQKLTKAQTAALKTIDENPRRVVAWNRVAKGFVRINGNTESKLHSLGLIETQDLEERIHLGCVYMLRTWTLTAAGEAALGRTVEPVQPVDIIAAMRAAAEAEGRRMGLSDDQVAQFISRMA
jgi:hypothetical protein